MREAARAEMRAEATILDLWVERPGASNFRVLEGPAFTVGTSRHAWVIMAGDDGALILSPGDAKNPTLRAAFGDDDWDESGGIVVVGPSIDEGDDDGSYTGGNYGDGTYPGGPEGPDIGEGGVGDNLDQQEQNDCRDRNALDAKDAINSESDRHTKEHAVIVYRDAQGGLHKTGVIEGNYARLTLEVIQNYMNTHGISRDQVIAFVHNHPAWVYASSPELAAVNRYPSANDWGFAQWMVNGGAGGANGEGFAMYVIDTAGKMREFEYGDRSRYENLSQSQRERGTDLPAETRSDGSSCG